MRKILAEITIDFPEEEKIPYKELEEMFNEALHAPPEPGVEDKSSIKFLRVIFNSKKKKKKKKFVHLPQ